MSKKNIIIIAAVSLVVLAVIGGGFFMLWQKLSTLDSSREGSESGKHEEKKEQGGMGQIFSLEPFIVNLSDQGGKRYLRITMGLELGDPKYAEELTKRLPQIRDSILMILPTRKVDELQSSEGKNSLRTEIQTSLNGLLAKEAVKKIYFTEFVIQ
jgi:flagellar FliL protein